MVKYIDIADDIRSKIFDKKYTYGQKLPYEYVLCVAYHCNKETMKKALDILVIEGLIVRRRGAGTFVKDYDASSEDATQLKQSGLGITRKLKGKGELKSDIANAKKTSKLNRLYSPVNGEVIAKNLAPGDFVTGGVSVITIADMDKTQIRTEYIGSSVLDRASGYQAVINGKKYKVSAQEHDVSQMDVEMGNLPTSTYFGYEKDAKVAVGDSVTLEFYNNATEDALVVPSNAVFKAKSEHYVYRMDGDAKNKVNVTLVTKT